jgi:hypothetical protein
MPKRSFQCLFLIICFGAGAAKAVEPSTEARSLFNGRDLSGWNSWLGIPEVPAIPFDLRGNWPSAIGINQDPAGVFSVVTEDGAPAIRISGEIWGALVSEHAYSDYHLRLQYKWGPGRYAPRAEKPPNSGLLYHSIGEHGAFWSYWMRSAEFEIMQGSTGDFSSVDSVAADINTVWDWSAPIPWQRYQASGSATSVSGAVFRVSASADHERPVGEWNTLDLYTQGDTAIHLVNGIKVLQADNLRHPLESQSQPLTSGRLQLQSEGAEIYFRDIEFRPLSGNHQLPE